MQVELNFEKMRGLVPAVVQDVTTGMVRMAGFMDREALELTLSKGLVHFYSRTRKRIWMKGETSGNVLRVVDVIADCDRDAVLIKAVPAGPTCHTGAPSCFHNTLHTRRDELFRALVEDAFRRSLVQVRGCTDGSGKRCLHVVNPLTDNIPPPDPLLVSLVVDRMLSSANLEAADKVVAYEAPSLLFASVMALRAGRPLVVMRRRPCQLPGEIVVGHGRGAYYVYGLERGDRIVLASGAVSTGRALVAVIRALKSYGVEVVDAVTVVSEPQYGGEERVLRETGVRVKSALRVFAEEDGRLVVEDFEGRWRIELVRPVLGKGWSR